ncbi:MAG: hypothetical protein QM638_11035 [Nocardioides sp.]|uniref:hypothetical protein n=1 Tax=Nocardioides sp. TaxID=35761 RepID=UPI0039E67B91
MGGSAAEVVRLAPADAFKAIPATLRDDVLAAFNEIVNNFEQRRWEPAELNGGKLCEAVYTVIRGLADGTYPARSNKPRNILDACKDMEKATGQPRSVKIQIPRMIVALYEIRSNRGVGHAGGDVDPNEMDATAVLYMSKWLVAELVRVLHTLSTAEATELVEALIERQVALVWASGDKKRVLVPGLSWHKNTLLLLLSETGEIIEADLLRWIEHKSVAVYRRDVLRPGHKKRMWEYDETDRTIRLLPPGIAAAEKVVHELSN